MAAAPLLAASAASTATAISVAMAVQQVVQQRANAKAQEEAAVKHNEQVVTETIANYDQLASSELSKQQGISKQSLDVQKEYLAKKGRINVTAAAYGTAGQSLEGQLKSINKDKLNDYSTLLHNQQIEQDSVKSQAENLKYQAGNSMKNTISPI